MICMQQLKSIWMDVKLNGWSTVKFYATHFLHSFIIFFAPSIAPPTSVSCINKFWIPWKKKYSNTRFQCVLLMRMRVIELYSQTNMKLKLESLWLKMRVSLFFFVPNHTNGWNSTAQNLEQKFDSTHTSVAETTEECAVIRTNANIFQDNQNEIENLIYRSIEPSLSMILVTINWNFRTFFTHARNRFAMLSIKSGAEKSSILMMLGSQVWPPVAWSGSHTPTRKEGSGGGADIRCSPLTWYLLPGGGLTSRTSQPWLPLIHYESPLRSPLPLASSILITFGWGSSVIMNPLFQFQSPRPPTVSSSPSSSLLASSIFITSPPSMKGVIPTHSVTPYGRNPCLAEAIAGNGGWWTRS